MPLDYPPICTRRQARSRTEAASADEQLSLREWAARTRVGASNSSAPGTGQARSGGTYRIVPGDNRGRRFSHSEGDRARPSLVVLRVVSARVRLAQASAR